MNAENTGSDLDAIRESLFAGQRMRVSARDSGKNERDSAELRNFIRQHFDRSSIAVTTVIPQTGSGCTLVLNIAFVPESQRELLYQKLAASPLHFNMILPK